MDELKNNINEDIDDVSANGEVEAKATESSAEETATVETAEETVEYESTDGEDNFSEEVMEVALTADENGIPVETTLSGLTDEQKRRRMIFDKITTGILIFLLASPVMILLYIFLWFILR